MFEKKSSVRSNVPKTDSSDTFKPVLSAAELLSSSVRSAVVAPLEALTELDSTDFQELCQPVIEKVAEFVQSLPCYEMGIFSDEGGMLDFILERTHSVMTLIRSCFLPINPKQVLLTKPQQLWAYAVLTATLLKDLGRVALQCKVYLLDQEKKILGDWHPFEGSMIDQKAAFYQYTFSVPQAALLLQETTICLAKNFMPIRGFEWIASDPNVFKFWFALLQGDEIDTGTLSPIFLRAESLVIQQYLVGFHHDSVTAELGKGLFADFLGKERLPKEVTAKSKKEAISKTLVAFFNWIKAHLRAGTMQLGKNKLKLNDRGKLFLTENLFKAFVTETGSRKKWQSVEKSLLQSGLISNSEAVSRALVNNAAQSKSVVLDNIYLTLPSEMALSMQWQPELQAYVSVESAAGKQKKLFISPEGKWMHPSNTKHAFNLSEQKNYVSNTFNQGLNQKI